MTEAEMLEINLEVKMATHRKGEPYPTLNFGKFQYRGDLSRAPDPMKLLVSQEQVPQVVDALHQMNKHKNEVAFFYLAEAETVDSL